MRWRAIGREGGRGRREVCKSDLRWAYLAPPLTFTERWPTLNEHPVVVTLGWPLSLAPNRMLTLNDIPPPVALTEPWSDANLKQDEIFLN